MFRLRVCLQRAFRTQECEIVLGSCTFRESRGERPGEKWKHCKASVRELEARRKWESFFSFCQPGSHDGEGDSHDSTLTHRWR